MAKKLQTLQNEQNRLFRQQTQIHQEILANCIDPHRISFLLHQMNDLAIKHNHLQQQILAELERQRKPWWERYFKA